MGAWSDVLRGFLDPLVLRLRIFLPMRRLAGRAAVVGFRPGPQADNESGRALLAETAPAVGRRDRTNMGCNSKRGPRHGGSRISRSCVVRFRSGKWQTLGTSALHPTTGACTRQHVVTGPTRKRGGVG